jgi:tetratricopeptide (TPR) repeat protein
MTGPQSVLLGVDKARRQAYYMKAQALDRAGKFKEAFETLKKTVEMAPDYLEAHFSLGDFYFKMNNLDAAEKEFLRVLEDAPDDQRSKEYLVLIKAKRQVEEERNKPAPQKVVLLYEAALRDYGKHDLDKADDKLLEALRIAAELKADEKLRAIIARVRLLLGRIRYDRERWDDAGTHLQAGLKVLEGMDSEGLEFQLGELHYWHGTALIAGQSSFKDAVRHLTISVPFLRKAAESSKSAVVAAELLVHSAQVNRTLMKYEQALSDYDRAAEILPQYPQIHYLAARAAANAKNLDKAVYHYTKSAQQGTRVYESYFELGKLLLEHDRDMEAIVNFQSALKHAGNASEAAECNYSLGEAFYKSGMYPMAVLAWREFLKLEQNPEKRVPVERKLAEDPKLRQK